MAWRSWSRLPKTYTEYKLLVQCLRMILDLPREAPRFKPSGTSSKSVSRRGESHKLSFISRPLWERVFKASRRTDALLNKIYEKNERSRSCGTLCSNTGELNLRFNICLNSSCSLLENQEKSFDWSDLSVISGLMLYCLS